MAKKMEHDRSQATKQDVYNAAQLLRPLQWLNKILDALIQILKSQHKFGAPVSPGTKALVTLCKEFKHRAIFEGFDGWFPEGESEFIDLYYALEEINLELAAARKLAHNKDECRARLGRAHELKHELIRDHFPDFLSDTFVSWYRAFDRIDQTIERLIEELRLSWQNLTQEDLEKIIRKLKRQIRALGNGGDDAALKIDLDFMRGHIEFLLDQVRSGDWQIDRTKQRKKIIKSLRRLRKRKHNLIGSYGEYGGTSFLDWYKALFNIDLHITNAADLWFNGQYLPEWDPETVIRIIKRAEVGKSRFVRLFPEYLNESLEFWYEHLYKMDLYLDLAGDLLELGHVEDALKALNKVRRNKHTMEKKLNKMH